MRASLFSGISVTALVVAVGACGTHQTDGATGEERSETATTDLRAAKFFGTSLPPKTLALTFDDGPGDRAGELSAYLKAQGIPAAFFVNGNRIAMSNLPNPNNIGPTANVSAILAQIVADGHLVANHTATHRDLVTEVLPTGSSKLLQELSDTDADIAAYVPPNRFLFRPPYGSWDQNAYDSLKASAMNKYVGPIDWEVGGFSNAYPNAAADWACWQGKLYAGAAKANGTGYATTTECGDAYVKEIDSIGKGIVLMHDPYFWANGSTVDMVKYIVPILKAKGYSFVRVDEVPAIAAMLPPPSCNAGKYLSGGSCHTCTACADGQYESGACTPTTNRACSPCHASCETCSAAGPAACTSCKPNTFLNGSTCSACKVCGSGTFEQAACTDGADTVCGACNGSCTACAGPNADQCGMCPANFYLSSGTCHACTACAAGTAPTAACTATANTTCAACPAGTFAPTGAASCTSCGSCDDANACTHDTCDPAKGCVHSAIAGCSAPPAHGGSPAKSPVPPEANRTSSGAPESADAPGGDASEDANAASCGVAHGARTDVWTGLALGVLGLVLRRRRATHAADGRPQSCD